MKKALVILLVLICFLGLVGCDPGTNHLDKKQLLQNTTKIELYQYENENPKLIRIGARKKPVFDFNKATLIATLDDSHVKEVVEDIAKHEMLVFGRTLNEPIGKTMVLHQSNGNMLVMYGCIYKKENSPTKYYGMCDLFDENGTFVEYLGDIDSSYVNLLESKYFESDT